MIVIQPELAEVMARIDEILHGAKVAFVKDDEGQSNSRIYATKCSETEAKIAWVAWNTEESKVELYGWMEALAQNYVKEGLDENDAPAWLPLNGAVAFANWLQGKWEKPS